MGTKTTVAIAMAAGFVGGILSQRIVPVPAYAQTPVSKEIRAESFVVVDTNGAPRGAFGVDKQGSVRIEAIDTKGHVSWPRWWWATKGGPLMILDDKVKPKLVPAQ